MSEKRSDDSVFSDFEPRSIDNNFVDWSGIDIDIEFPDGISDCLDEHFFQFVVLPAVNMMRTQLMDIGQAENDTDMFHFAVLYPKVAALGRDANIARIVSMN